ncbi:FAD-dependent oxidoreductase [Phorcysia thermohydrogeniphila]|uniref:NADPH-dependent glutamate synthase beta subunit-like oxidoreductase n=1 Tax=Phorcysia thermohydrogeniphila TaxID=936138 RepID=A0A4R1GED3_9BACT|nr:FAD-dependent oxidoreductase [Phorcysia thermohydrogeniphila]TCK06308.1 NADPH-dependent glutamate synthase beta subunit-like oxidoreductase [Phorcysia thermohydrogeniphila]
MVQPDKFFSKLGKEELQKRKKAFFLSLILPGLGQVYQGRTLTGIAFLVIFLFPFYYLYLLGFSLNYGSVALVLSQLLLYVLQAVDAKKGSKRETSPCEDFCPAGINVPTFMSYAEEGDFERALGSIFLRAPLPFTLGRICPAPCEEKCGVLPERPLKIREVHAELGRIFLEKTPIKRRKPFFPPVEKKVAVVGGGVAGLTAAYYLASAGVKVDIFEKERELGGILNVIPDFKLNKELMRKEIAFITSFENVRIFTGTEIKSPPKDYDAIVIATGSQVEKKLNIPTSGNPAIIYPLSFLKNPPELKNKRVVIIGAGDTAFDVARLTARNGGEALVFYRGESQEMKAQQKEISAAVREGVRIYTNCTPVAVEGNRIEFSCGKLQFDYLVPAIGFEKDREFLKAFGISGEKPYENGIYLAGDVLNGMSSAVTAVRDGRNVAERILKELGLSERIWFSLDFYHPKPEKPCGENLFIVSESSLCQHCGIKVKS